MKNAIAVKDAALLAKLGAMVNKDDGGGEAAQIPVMKINYDPDSAYDRGLWVVGQQKDQDGNIIDEGKLVKGFVFFVSRHRYSFYDPNGNAKPCNSPFFIQKPGVKVRGSEYKNICGKTCPYREEGRNPRCKAQMVYFGMALTEDKKFVECISYQGGASYMNASNYAKYITSLKAKAPTGGYMDLPPFYFLTMLNTKKEKNQGTTYFVSQFKLGPNFENGEQLDLFAEKREGVYAYIDSINSLVEEGSEEAPAAPPVDMSALKTAGATSTPAPDTGLAAMAAEGAANTPTDVPDFNDEDLPPWMGADNDADSEVVDVKTTEPAESKPMTEPANAEGGDFDIDDAIKQALGGVES